MNKIKCTYAERRSVRQIEQCHDKSEYVNAKAGGDNGPSWAPTAFRGEHSENSPADDLTDTDANSREADQTLSLIAHGLGEADTGRVDGREERQRQSGVDKRQREQQHVTGEEETEGVLEGAPGGDKGLLPRRVRDLQLFISAGHTLGWTHTTVLRRPPHRQQQDQSDGRDTREHLEDEIAHILLNVRLLEDEVDEDVADEQRRLEDGPEEARVARHGLAVAVDGEERAVTRPRQRGTHTHEDRGRVEELGAREEERRDEEDVAGAADDDAGARARHRDERRCEPVAERERAIYDGETCVAVAVEARIVLRYARQDGFLWKKGER